MSFLAQKNAKAQDTKIANLDGDLLSTNQESIPVPYHTGYAPQAVKWITKAFNVKVEDVTAQTGKKSRSTVARNYFADIAGVVCHGVVSYLLKVIINQNTVWDGLLERDGSGTGSKYKTITIDGWGEMTIYWGTEDQDASPLLTSTTIPNPAYVKTYDEGTGVYSDNGEPEFLPGMTHPAYRGLCYVVFKKLLFGRETTNAPTIVLEVGRLGDCPLAFDQTETVEGVSPLIPAYELLVNKRFGFGQDPGIIHDASWIATAEAIKPGATAFVGRQITNLSCQLTRATAMKEIFAELSSYYDGWFRLNEGLIEAGFYPHAAPASEVGLLVIDPQDMARGQDPDIKFNGWVDTFNQVYLTGRDRYRLFKNSPQPYQSLYNYKITGENRAINLTKPWCITADNAKLLGADIGKIEAVPYASGTLYCRSERVEDLLPGDVFRLNYSPLSINFLCRCTGLTYPDANGGVTQVSFIQERGVMPDPYQPVTDDAPEPPQLPATKAGMAKIVELTNAFTGTQETTVAILVTRPHQSALGYLTKFARVSPNYEDLSDHAFFAQHVRLDVAYSAVASGAMTLTVGGLDLTALVSQSDDQRDDNTLLMFMGNEMFSIGAVTPLGSNQYSVVLLRARGGTVAQSHAQYAQGFIIERAKLNTATSRNFVSNTTGYFKIMPYTTADSISDVDGLVVSLAFRDREADRPVIAWDTAAATAANVGETLTFTGTITDANSDLVQYAVVAQKVSGATILKEVVAISTIIDPTNSVAFKAMFTLWESGTWRIVCRAMDSRNTDDGYAEKFYDNNVSPTNITVTGSSVYVSLNGKNKTFYQTSAPGSGMIEGDVWFDTDDGFKMYRYTSGSWVNVQDGRIPTLTSGLSGLTGTVGTLTTTVTDLSDYVTTEVSTLYDGLDDIGAEYVLKVTGTGPGETKRVAGFRVTAYGGAGGDTEFVIQADKFYFVTTGASDTAVSPFYILGGVVYIDKTFIREVNAGSILAGSITVALEITSPTITGGGIYIDSSVGMRYTSDSGVFTITGGGDNGSSHGAQIDLAGNTLGTSASGVLVLAAGDTQAYSSVNGTIRFRTANTERAMFEYGGKFYVYGALRVGGLMTGEANIRMNDGSDAAPAYSFTNHTNCGMRDRGDGTLGFVTGGVQRLVVRDAATVLLNDLKLNVNKTAIGALTPTHTVAILQADGSTINLVCAT